MSELNDDSYKLDLAGRLSANLLHPKEKSSDRSRTAANDSTAKAPRFTRFRGLAQSLCEGAVNSSNGETAFQSGHGGGRAPSNLPPSSVPPFSVEGIRSWDEFVHRCLDKAAADVAFVVDTQGLAVAAAGPDGHAYAEEVGARVLIALDQAREMDHLAGNIVTFELSEDCVFGLRHEGEDMTMVLVIRSQQPVGAVERDALASALGAYCEMC